MSDSEFHIGTAEFFRGLKMIMLVATVLERDESTASYGELLRNACDLITEGAMIELGTKERELENLRESLRRNERVWRSLDLGEPP